MMEKMKTNHVIGCQTAKGQPRPQTGKDPPQPRTFAVTGGEFEQNCLMKLRIPLNYDGHAIEWTGKWSDGSSQWNSRLRQYLAYSGKSDDGTFWMAYADFCRHFNKVYMCRMLDDLWTRFAVKSRWMDVTAGGTDFIRGTTTMAVEVHRPATARDQAVRPRRAEGGWQRPVTTRGAIGFSILKGNAPNAAKDELRRKLILDEGDGVTEGPNGEVGDYLFQTGTMGRVSDTADSQLRMRPPPRFSPRSSLPPQTPSSRGKSQWSTRSRSRARRRTC